MPQAQEELVHILTAKEWSSAESMLPRCVTASYLHHAWNTLVAHADSAGSMSSMLFVLKLYASCSLWHVL